MENEMRFHYNPLLNKNKIKKKRKKVKTKYIVKEICSIVKHLPLNYF